MRIKTLTTAAILSILAVGAQAQGLLDDQVTVTQSAPFETGELSASPGVIAAVVGAVIIAAVASGGSGS
mgnify:CR=1 FL=1